MVTHLTQTTFRSLGLDNRLIEALDSIGYDFCTPIQEKALPFLIQGKNVAGQAQTGTGKTLTFLLAAIQDMLTLDETEHRLPNDPRTIILAPTRELAIQIYDDAVKLCEKTGFKCGLAYGGEDWEKQANNIRDGVDILIGTPGRLIDFFKQKVFSFYALDIVILDEADRMFDLGFIADIRFLFKRMPAPEDRFNMLFSATMSFKVNELAYEYMNNPQIVSVENTQVTAKNIEQSLYYPQNDQKIPLLVELFQQHSPEKSIVFCNTKRDSETVWRYLRGNDIRVGLLTGDVQQRKRNQLLEAFKEGSLDCLVATDVAARGLHIPLVSHVFNFDLPDDAEDYVHRIGRTGRAGASGIAISFACEDSSVNLPDIETYIEMSIPVSQFDPDEIPVPKPAVQRQPRPQQNRQRNKRNTQNRRPAQQR
jgi:ATP-dependent RNA helicase RhlB